MTTWNRWQDYAVMVLGALTFISPFVFGDTSQTTAATTAYAGGVLLVLAGVLGAATRAVRMTEWVPFVLGVLLFVSPWVLGFTGVAAIAWTAWIIGIPVVLAAGSVLVANRQTAAA
jgi:hypothetical protein